MAIALGPPAGPSTPSPRTALLTNITATSALLSQLFTALSSPHTTSTAPTSTSSSSANGHPAAQLGTIYAALQSTTLELEAISKDIRAHQVAFERLGRQEAEVRDLEGNVRRALGGLERARAELEVVVQDGQETVASIERREREPINVSVLLSHARNLAKHSSAPVSKLLQPIDRAQSQPWPTETSMRQGILFAEGGSMVGLGDVGHQVAVDVDGGAAGVGDGRDGATGAGAGAGAGGQGDGVMDWERREAGGPGPVFTLDLNSDSEQDD